jgi:hypothetical protein
MLLTISDFKDEARIPMLMPENETTDPSYVVVKEEVESYIRKYEPVFMDMFLAEKSLYTTLQEYDSHHEESSDMYDSLIEALRMSLSHYVSFYYHRSRIVTPIGGVELQSEHGKRTSLIDIQVLLWNQMVDNNLYIYRHILESVHPHTEIFTKINSFNL